MPSCDIHIIFTNFRNQQAQATRGQTSQTLVGPLHFLVRFEAHGKNMSQGGSKAIGHLLFGKENGKRATDSPIVEFLATMPGGSDNFSAEQAAPQCQASRMMEGLT